jgi:DNA-binding NarL/FixJ family response regulator
MQSYSIVLADDHVMFRQGIRSFLENQDDLTIVGEAKDGLELLEIMKTTVPDLAIVDIVMPKMRGLEVLREIRLNYPSVKILFLTMHGKLEYIRQAIADGVNGFLLKEEPRSELIKAINTIRDGKKYFSPLLSSTLSSLIMDKDDPRFLTQREKDILKCLASGMKVNEISNLLSLSAHTVRRHRQNIMQKLNLQSLTDLVKYAISHGYSE